MRDHLGSLPYNARMDDAEQCDQPSLLCARCRVELTPGRGDFYVERLGSLRLAGVYTQEIRRHGQRVGFAAVGLDGTQRELGQDRGELDLYTIDEIGKMECLSRMFVEEAAHALDGPFPVLATVALKGGGFIREVKARGDVEVLAVSRGNREDLPATLAARLRNRK